MHMFKVCVLCGQDPISTNMVLVGLVVHMQHMIALIHPLIGAHHCKIICVQGNSTFLKYSFHFYLKSPNLESSKKKFLIIFMLTTFTYLLTLYKPTCIFTYVHIYLFTSYMPTIYHLLAYLFTLCIRTLANIVGDNKTYIFLWWIHNWW